METQNTIRPILFFDGECNLCNSSVQFVIRHDRKKQFFFGTLQSESGKDARKALGDNAPDSVVLFYKGWYYVRSDAALRLFELLGGAWSLLYVFILVPRFIRDAIYNLVSSNRYKWFGKRSECMIPTPELKERFLV
jgi:predicted DCC family thiol-disulfide oxidoreductase YuxK